MATAGEQSPPTTGAYAGFVRVRKRWRRLRRDGVQELPQCSGATASDRVLIWASLSVLTALVTCILFVTFRIPLKDDIAWLLYVAHRVTAGHELYVDVVEVNPPLIIWLSAIPVKIAQWLNTRPKFVALPMFLAFVLACAWWTAGLLRKSAGWHTSRVPVFAAISAVLLILPAADIGQREHLLTAAFLPYIVLFAWSLRGGRLPIAASIGAGVLAGLGCALKPRYGAVFGVLECLALLHGLRPWRALVVAAGVTLILYGGLVAMLCPAYLDHAVPMAIALYGATDIPLADLLAESAPLILGMALTGVVLLFRRPRGGQRLDDPLALSLFLFALTSLFVCFVDGKDWFYHRIPATTGVVLCLLLCGLAELRPGRRRRSVPLAATIAAFVLVSVATVRQLGHEVQAALDPRQSTVERLQEIIRDNHAHTYMAFSEWLALGFPVVNNTGVVWASRFDSMWALKGEVWRQGFDPAVAKVWPVAQWVAQDFLADCPDIAVVDTRESTPYIAVLSRTDRAFARAWRRYRRIAAFDGLVVYRRARGGCLDAWVAAEAALEPPPSDGPAPVD